MKNISQNEFKSEVREFKGVALVDFYADWCGPCKMLSPLLEEMSKSNTDSQVKFLKMNVDTEQAIAQILGIQSIPTVVVFKDGLIVNQMVGVSPKADYSKAIESAKKSEAGASRKVIVFSTPTCPYCHQAKAYLKEKGVAFEDVDVSKDQQKAQQMVEKSGQMGVPQLWIDDQVVVGFNRPQINMMLGIR
jgi:thioredoxin 1